MLDARERVRGRDADGPSARRPPLPPSPTSRPRRSRHSRARACRPGRGPCRAGVHGARAVDHRRAASRRPGRGCSARPRPPRHPGAAVRGHRRHRGRDLRCHLPRGQRLRQPRCPDVEHGRGDTAVRAGTAAGRHRRHPRPGPAVRPRAGRRPGLDRRHRQGGQPGRGHDPGRRRHRDRPHDRSGRPGTAIGSGVIFDASGLILTNHHVVAGNPIEAHGHPQGRPLVRRLDLRRSTR